MAKLYINRKRISSSNEIMIAYTLIVVMSPTKWGQRSIIIFPKKNISVLYGLLPFASEKNSKHYTSDQL